jgi:YD repeat-containing protein
MGNALPLPFRWTPPQNSFRQTGFATEFRDGLLIVTKRLISVKSGEHIPLRYEYDEKGRKSVIESYDSKPLPTNMDYAAHWEGTDSGFAPFPGGTLITLYNEQGVATGAQLHDGSGKLVAHIARKFDDKSRIVAEEQFADAPELMVPEELRSDLNADQLRTMGSFMAGGLHKRAITYSYDARSRHGKAQDWRSVRSGSDRNNLITITETRPRSIQRTS